MSDESLKERVKEYIKTADQEKISFYLAKRPQYFRRLYNCLCLGCSLKVRQAILVTQDFKLHDLSFFCEVCQGKLLPILDKIKFKCDKLYNK